MDLVTEAGAIQVMVGSSSADIRLTGQFEIIGPRKAKVGKRVTVCPAAIE
jgi:hypothetical protein